MGALVIPFNQKRIFTLEEAQALFPIVKKITRKSYDRVKLWNMQMNFIPAKSRKLQIDLKIQKELQSWHQKMVKLGCEVKGMWLVDFDNGEGYYCWQHPEPTLSFFHSYNEGFKDRVRIH